MNKKYVAALALAAAAVLTAGVMLRPKPQLALPQPPPAEQTPPPAPSRRGQMRQISEFLAERAREAADHLVYVASVEATGILWTTGQVVTVAPESGIVQTATVSQSPEPVPVSLAPVERFEQSGWMVAVARKSDGGSISTSGLMGGSADATCGSTPVKKLLFNVPIDAAFSGGGIFDISGDLLGIIVPCGQSFVAVAHSTVQQLLESQLGADAVAWHDFGVRAGIANEQERIYFRLPDTGIFIVEVRRMSRAYNMGLQPGDLLLRSGDQTLERPEDLLALGDEITLWRGARQITMSVMPPFSLDEPRQAPTLTSVQPGTRLFAGGLRPGDRILSPSPSELKRLLARGAPTWLIFERDDRQVGVLLP